MGNNQPKIGYRLAESAFVQYALFNMSAESAFVQYALFNMSEK